MMMLKETLGDIAGLDALVIGRSLLFGKPAAQLLLAANATVTMAHSKTRNLPARARQADILVAAIGKPELVTGEWIKPGALVVPYGTMSAVEFTLTDIMHKIVVDDWGQCRQGMFGSLRAHVEGGRLSERTLYGELGQIVAGAKAGRENDQETILLWHRGLGITDIALGHAMLGKAARMGIGQSLVFAKG
jgi:ornithine cyclodeaminase